MRINYTQIGGWPPLAWLAVIDKSADNIVQVQHGRNVEIRDNWFCEATWDGVFEEGNFDQTDLVAGSGGRLRDGQLTFVSSGSTVDRLHSADTLRYRYVSNSLPCVLAATDLEFDLPYNRYPDDFYSIVEGLEKYRKDIQCLGGSIQLTYFNNLIWTGQALINVSKPGLDRHFDCFQTYYEFLTSGLERIIRNMSDEHRNIKYQPLGTLSTGYDSTTITALLCQRGLREVICFERRGRRDSGSALAHYFGVKPVTVDIEGWQTLPNPEIPFLACNGIGEEVHYSGAGGVLRNRVLMTGYHGDKIWEKTTPYTSPDLVRGDVSGMSLMEYRLEAGFIHCPVTFFGARQVADLKRIAHQPEMAPWDIGGDYNRPICRRIVEQQGVPRDAFGALKSYASRWVVTKPEGLTENSMREFTEWLRPQLGAWIKQGKVPPLCHRGFDRWRLQLLRSLGAVSGTIPGFYRFGFNKQKLFVLINSLDMDNIKSPPIFGLRRHFMPWALHQACQRYK